jgi:hypothetical protein
MLKRIVTDGCTVNAGGPWTKTSLTDKLLATGFEFVDGTNVANYVGKSYGLPDQQQKVLDTVPQFLTCP